MPPRFLPRTHLAALLELLQSHGYLILGPQLIDDAILYRPLKEASALPHGVGVEQQPGSYRVVRRADARCFAWANGPQALKPLTFAPEEIVWQVRRDAQGALVFDVPSRHYQATAVLGVRSCDLAALQLQEAHFLGGVGRDEHFAARHAALFLIAVNCSHPAATCFCASTGDGPNCSSGYDLLLDELEAGFVIRSGSEAGATMLAQLPWQALESHHTTALAAQQRAAADQSRRLPSRQLRSALFAALDHPRWQEVATRCLACGNCTSVCPTCFCHSEHDAPQLSGASSSHLRQWDSCFTAGHSYIHGMVVRGSIAERYRQWLTHKLGSWHDQYGRSGCVGCGRCIAWCPVGIDITEEVAAICGECAS
ncbi:MAG TPA: 4Fe-4S dicluster domain-containing protein [Gammaproteobacteria bacterium]